MKNELSIIVKIGVCIALLCTLCASCRQDRKKALLGKWHVTRFENNFQMLTGKWNAVKLTNSDLDNFFSSSQHYIDTVGRNNDAATNYQLYKVTNMDSMRRLLQLQLDSAKHMQDQAVTTTSFYFAEDGLALLNFQGKLDSSFWYIDSLGNLVLDGMNDSSKGEKVQMEIVSISDSALQLRFSESGAQSIVTFHPEGDRQRKTQPQVETFFTFRADSVVNQSYGGKPDSSRWYLENDSTIVVRSMDRKQDAGEMKWDIRTLTDSKLELKIVESSSVSILTFDRSGK